MTLKTKSSTKESLVEDKETKFEKIEEGMDQRNDDDDDDGDTSDSSVYSGLEEEGRITITHLQIQIKCHGNLVQLEVIGLLEVELKFARN